MEEDNKIMHKAAAAAATKREADVIAIAKQYWEGVSQFLSAWREAEVELQQGARFLLGGEKGS